MILVSDDLFVTHLAHAFNGFSTHKIVKSPSALFQLKVPQLKVNAIETQFLYLSNTYHKDENRAYAWKKGVVKTQ
jgi:exopolysaccharide biosynthesis predicted pyruvyltransferase EpsI